MKEFQEQENINNASIACELCSQEYSYEKTMETLKNGDVLTRQPAILNLQEIKTQNDADLLLSLLIGQDGRIREAAAFKINELIKIYPQYFQNEISATTLLKSIIDVNPAICRFSIDSLKFFQNKDIIVKRILDEITKIKNELNEVPRNSRKYVLNKMNFKIYWFFEALSLIIEKEIAINYQNEIKEIMNGLIDSEEYTIREKLHKFCIILEQNGVENLEKYFEHFQNDENFYVRNLSNIKMRNIS